MYPFCAWLISSSLVLRYKQVTWICSSILIYFRVEFNYMVMSCCVGCSYTNVEHLGYTQSLAIVD